MCGIVGMAGNLTGNTDKMLKQMLIVDALRGTDSTGIVAINRNDDYSVVKQLGDPFQLFEMKVYDKAIAKMNRAIIGHNRFATQGQVTKVNAHPFDFPNVVGVHNGTLRNKWVLEGGNDYAVDSQALYNHIDKKGITDAISKLDGAWALVWWDKNEECLNFLRNSERPLWLAYNEDKSVLFWASEPWMINVTGGRNNIKHEEPWMLREDTLLTVYINKQAKIIDADTREVKSEYVPFVGQRQNNGASNVQSLNSNKAPTPSPAPAPKVVEAKDTVIQIPSVNSVYAGKKDRKLRVLAKCSDNNGALFLSCMDLNQQVNGQIRLYIHVNSPDGKLVGETIIGDIAEKAHYNDKSGLYYKVEYSSIKREKPVEEVKPEKKIVNIPEETLFKDHLGRDIDETHWYMRYTGICAMCNGDINPNNDEYRYTSQADILCKTCCDDPVTHQYVSLV